MPNAKVTPAEGKEAKLDDLMTIFNNIKADRLEAERLEAENRERLVLIVNELPESFVKRRILHILAPGSASPEVERNAPDVI